MEIPVETLRKRKLFVATPMYGGMATGLFTRSCCDLTMLAAHYGIEVKFFFLFNESLIPRARNYCVDEFLRSDSTHLMFIDADIQFNAHDVISLLALQDHEDKNNEYDVICGPYPKKSISWEKIKMAVDAGAADEDPNNLENFVGDYVFNPVGGNTIKLNEPVEVLEAGTGFMMIRRETFEKFDKAYPEYSYRPDHVRSEHFDGTRDIMMYFQALIDDKSKRYLSEDYMFCQWIRNIGLKVWLCPWIQLKHAGTYVFGGSLPALASIGATATVDPAQLVKKTDKKSKKK